jgi:hypothetical protein
LTATINRHKTSYLRLLCTIVDWSYTLVPLEFLKQFIRQKLREQQPLSACHCIIGVQ